MVAAKQSNSKSGTGWPIYNTIYSSASEQLVLQICHKFKKKTFTARKSTRNFNVNVHICKKTAYGNSTMKMYMEMRTLFKQSLWIVNFKRVQRHHANICNENAYEKLQKEFHAIFMQLLAMKMCTYDHCIWYAQISIVNDFWYCI